jgi:hypothetical protein
MQHENSACLRQAPCCHLPKEVLPKIQPGLLLHLRNENVSLFKGGTVLKRYRLSLILCLILVVLFATALQISTTRSHTAATQASTTVSPGKTISGKSVAADVVDMQKVPQETGASTSKRKSTLSEHLGVSSSVYTQRKKAAAHNTGAVKAQPSPAPLQKTPSGATQTPGLISSFAGMSDSAATCPYFGGCEPPDQALASSFQWVVQSVNTSIAVYSNPGGALQPGWPKNAQNFFHIPSPGSCDPNGPFLSDPRAFYDQNSNQLWVAMLQVEGAPVGNSCPFQSTYWIAVTSNHSGNPTGAWNVYHFDMSLGSGFWADYTQFGFDTQAIYFSGNMFNAAGTVYEYAEYFGARKAAMENGQAVTAFGFINPTLNNVSLDTIQPTLGESLKVGGPFGGQFIASENINFGGGQCSSGCSGIVVISVSNPGLSNTSASGIFVSTGSYSLAPLSDEPGCSQCIETLDTRISGTPTWQRGLITFGLETAINNGSQVVPGIFWGQINVSLNDSGAITGASVFQSGYYAYSGDSSASFGALGTDSDGDIYMVFEFMSSSVNPSVAYTARRVTLAPGTFHDGGIYLFKGLASYGGFRWGDYEAVSPGAVPFTNEVWFSGQYSNASGDWSTEIGHAKFVAGSP